MCWVPEAEADVIAGFRQDLVAEIAAVVRSIRADRVDHNAVVGPSEAERLARVGVGRDRGEDVLREFSEVRRPAAAGLPEPLAGDPDGRRPNAGYAAELGEIDLVRCWH